MINPNLISSSVTCLCALRTTAKILSEYQVPPKDQFCLIVRHMGTPHSPETYGEVSTSVTWNVDRYTGFKVPDPVALSQRGYKDDGVSGFNAYQSSNNAIGALVNTWSFDHTAPVQGGGPHVILNYDFSNGQAIWANGDLYQQAWITIPWGQTWNGGSGQVCFVTYLRDVSQNVRFAIVTQVFDTRARGVGNGTEIVAHDTFTPFISTAVMKTAKCTTIDAESAELQNGATTAVLPFGFSITRTNLSYIIAQLTMQGFTMSSDLSNYRLDSAGVIGEVFVSQDPKCNTSMGFSVKDFGVFALSTI